MESNEILDKLPRHLMSLVIDQPYNDYTARDHAIWRYVMRQNIKYLPGVAHSSYLDGLRRTGVSVEQIPHMYGMNRILREIGWAAVAVDGFIPPAAFMEFQAYNVLVIAADIRPIDQIEYTPAPDIIHEAAGHAPFIANEEYATYLKNFGFTGSRAFSSPYDNLLYEAIRHLSILKADPVTPKADIERAEAYLAMVEQQSNGPSEMALLRNLHWWTVEYGLIGTPDDPKIYGAGLLSSIGESFNCMKPEVKKIPYSIDAKNYSFDITTQQPQLFVTPDFGHLNKVLDEFESTLAVKNGGLEGLIKARNSDNICTAEYSSGLQVTGTLNAVTGCDGSPVYIGFSGPVMLSHNNQMIPGHSKEFHREGFGSPVGKLRGIAQPPELLDESDLVAHGIIRNKLTKLVYESGVTVSGILKDVIRRNGKNLILSFSGCVVTYRDKVLFRPEWGQYDMAVGSEINSVFSGAADPDAYEFSFPVPKEKTHKIVYSQKDLTLFRLYSEMREIREKNLPAYHLEEFMNVIAREYPSEWLLPLEILEYLNSRNELTGLKSRTYQHLDDLAKTDSRYSKVIGDGILLTGNQSL